MDRGCTEEEAIAAAGKVAELLDRYGLSLGEVELKEQACEGFGVDTGRRRFGPIDDCIPTVGAFCDCRVWSEKAADGQILVTQRVATAAEAIAAGEPLGERALKGLARPVAAFNVAGLR